MPSTPATSTASWRFPRMMWKSVDHGGRGAYLLREWSGRADIQLTPRAVFAGGVVVVVAQDAAWRSETSGAVTGQATPASVFIVRDGLIASVIRHPDLASALSAVGLDEADKV